MNRWQTFRYHLFVLITLLGCVAPFATRRLFPVHQFPNEDRRLAMTSAVSPDIFEAATVTEFEMPPEPWPAQQLPGEAPGNVDR